MKKEAAAQGVSAQTIAAALAGVHFDQAIVNKDRAQGVFAQTFLQFSDRMVADYRLKQGAANIAKYKPVFQKIEKQYGVPAPVIVAFWGLETDFGANIGKGPTLISLATLAYDCRRPDVFRPQLIDALKIIDRGDLSPGEMRGPWAGELGQLQFLPSHYFDYGVDFDGDGRVNLLTSAPDALASAGNMLAKFGWRRGEPWLQEVRVPAEMPWQEADIAIQHSRAEWAKWGVTYPGGKPLPADAVPASLLLPMGREGPAFLAYANFQVYFQWNSSLVYTDDGCLLRHPARRRAESRTRQRQRRRSQPRRGSRAAAAPQEPWLRRRQDRRRHRPADAGGGEGHADQARTAGGFVSDRRSCWRS